MSAIEPADFCNCLTQKIKDPLTGWLYITLMTMADMSGKFQAGYTAIGNRAGMSRASVIRRIGILEKLELVSVQREKRIKGKEHEENIYTVPAAIRGSVSQILPSVSKELPQELSREEGSVSQILVSDRYGITSLLSLEDKEVSKEPSIENTTPTRDQLLAHPLYVAFVAAYPTNKHRTNYRTETLIKYLKAWDTAKITADEITGIVKAGFQREPNRSNYSMAFVLEDLGPYRSAQQKPAPRELKIAEPEPPRPQIVRTQEELEAAEKVKANSPFWRSVQRKREYEAQQKAKRANGEQSA